MAVISSDFSDDRFEEGIKPAMIAGQIDNRIESIPFTPGSFAEDDPLVWEIKKDNIPIKNVRFRFKIFFIYYHDGKRP